MALYLTPSLNDCIEDGVLLIPLPDGAVVEEGLVVYLNTGSFSNYTMSDKDVGAAFLTQENEEFPDGRATYDILLKDGSPLVATAIAEEEIYTLVFTDGLFEVMTEVFRADVDDLQSQIDGVSGRVSALESSTGEGASSDGPVYGTAGGTDANTQLVASRVFVPEGYGSNLPLEAPCYIETSANTEGDHLMQAIWPASKDAEMVEWRRSGEGELKVSPFSEEIPFSIKTLQWDEENETNEFVTLYETALACDINADNPMVYVGRFGEVDDPQNCVEYMSGMDVYASPTFELPDDLPDSWMAFVNDAQIGAFSDGVFEFEEGESADSLCTLGFLSGTIGDDGLTVGLKITGNESYTGDAVWGEWVKLGASSSSDNEGGGNGDGGTTGDSPDLSELEAEVENHEYRVGVLETRTAEISAQAETFVTRLDNLEEETSKISGIEETLSDHDTRISRVQTEANDIASDMSKAQFDIDDLQTKVASLESGETESGGSIGELKEKVEDHESRISTLEAETADVSTYSERLAEVEAKTAECVEKVESYDEVIATVGAEVSEFGERISVAEAKVSACEENVSELSSSFDELNDNVATMSGQFDTLKETVDGFDGRLSNAESTASQAKTTADGLESRIAAVETGLENDTSSWTNLSQSFVRLDSDVISVTSRVDAVEETVAELASYLDVPLYFEADALPATFDYAVDYGFYVRMYVPEGLTHVEFREATVNTWAASDSTAIRVAHLFEGSETVVVDALSVGEKSAGVSNRVREGARSLLKIYMSCPNSQAKLDETGERASAFAYLRLYFG